MPVVASDEVGLPEVVRPGWGRLVPPGDAESLAGAISSVLSLDSEELAEMGRAGRTWVLEHANADREAERLVALALGRVPDQSGSAQSAGRPGG